MNPLKITVETEIIKDINQVWHCWTEPEHITGWYFASIGWHCPRASNDLREGGRFNFRMEAEDGSFGFDFEGTYTQISPNKIISYIMDDNREVYIHFKNLDNSTIITESFDPENENPLDMQQFGWQAILNNFKNYVESI